MNPRLALAATLATATLGALLAHAPAPAHAGARPLEVTLIDMTPAPDADSRRCVGAIARPLRMGGEDYANLRRVSRAILLGRTGAPEDVDLGAVPLDALDGLRGRDLDAWILVDCRPTERRLDVLVFAGTGTEDLARQGHASRFSLRGVELVVVEGVGCLGDGSRDTPRLQVAVERQRRSAPSLPGLGECVRHQG